MNITYGENLLDKVLSIEMFIFPPKSYFSFLESAPSLNFSILISLTFAPSNLELMLLSLTYVLRCFDIVIL